MTALLQPALNALTRKWFIAVGGLLLGLVAAVACYGWNWFGLRGYEATAIISVAAAPNAGVTLPCTPATVPLLAGNVVARPSPAPADVPTIAPISYESQRVTTSVPAPGLVAIHYTALDEERAPTTAAQLAARVAVYCYQETAQAVKSANDSLAAQQLSLQKLLMPFDVQAGAVQQRAVLVAQLAPLQNKLIELQAAAANAQTQLAATIPVAYSEIQAADPTYQALAKRLNDDLVTYATLASEYSPKYARVIGFKQRVDVDRERLQARADELRQLPPALSKTYQTAQTAAVLAQSAVDVALAQIKAMQAQIDHDNALIKQNAGGAGNAQRSQAAYAASYAAVLTALLKQQSLLSQASVLEPVSIVSAPDTAIETGRLRAAIAALALLVVMTVLGLALAILIGLLDQRLLTVPQFIALYGKPVIATLEPKDAA